MYMSSSPAGCHGYAIPGLLCMDHYRTTIAHEETTLRAGEVKERWRSNKKRTGGREDIRKIGIC